MPTFVLGIVILSTGLALVVSDLTALSFVETGSVAGLAGGAVVLVAAIMAPRHDEVPDPEPPEPTVDEPAVNETLPETGTEVG